MLYLEISLQASVIMASTTWPHTPNLTPPTHTHSIHTGAAVVAQFVVQLLQRDLLGLRERVCVSCNFDI